MAYLRRGVEALDAGKGVEHDIIEADEGKRFGLMRQGRTMLTGKRKKNVSNDF